MFNAIAKPFGVLLMLLYGLVNNYGLALILFALLIRLILMPFQMKSKRGQIQMARLQPRIKELEKKHGANKQKYQAEVAKLYQDEKINPASGCLWGLLPLPIMLALYQAVIQPLTIMMGVASELLQENGAIFEKLTQLKFFDLPAASSSYPQLAQTQFISDNFSSFAGITDRLQQIDFTFLGVNLGEKPQWNFLWSTDWSNSEIWLPGLVLFLIPIVSGLAQFISSRIASKTNPAASPDGQGNSMKTMMMLMPLLSVYFGFAFPAALGIYWTAGAVFSTIQDIWLTKRYTRIIDAEEVVKNEQRVKREAEIEAKRIETERRNAENGPERNPNTSKRKLQTTEREGQKLRAAEYNKKDQPSVENEPGRVDSRRYARGRAYVPHRYNSIGNETADVNIVKDETADEEAGDTPDVTDVTDIPEVDLSLPDVSVDDFVFETENGEEEDDGK